MIRDEKKLYQTNRLSYNFVMIFIALNTAHAIFTLRNMIVDYSLGIVIMVTIMMTMLAFLCAVKLQAYSLRWSYIAIGISVIQMIRWLLTPAEITGQLAFYLNIAIASSIVSILSGAIIAIFRTKRRQAYIDSQKKPKEMPQH